MNYILLDLEWNGAPLYKTGGYFNEIIEIGAVKLDSDLKQISNFQMLVKPSVHKKLTGRVKRLTHISNDEVRAALNFRQTYARFEQWVGEEDNCFLSWGTGDILVLQENLEYFGMPEHIPSMKHYCDAQELCQRKLGIDRAKQPGLSAVAEQLGVACAEMDMHRALDDSIVTAMCVIKVWDEPLFKELCHTADGDFWGRLLFKPYYIYDIRNSRIKPEMLVQSCPDCGTELERFGEPVSRNRHLNICYHCPQCERDMIGRHQFKVRYDGLEHKVSWREMPKPEEESAENEAAAPEDGAEQ